MSNALANLEQVDTATLEAALMGQSVEPQPVIMTEPVEQAAALTPTTEQAEQPDQPVAGGEPAQTNGAEGSSPSPDAEAPPAQEAAAPEFSNLAHDEARALEIRRRNPDLSLEQSLDLARRQLGIEPEANNETAGEPEPTLEEKIAAIEAQLDEAGANDGLFTSEVAALTKEHGRLMAEQAVMRAEQSRHNEARTAVMQDQREASYQRAAAACPEALDANSNIGQSLSAVIAEAEATNNPLLYDPQAPELFLALANTRLPEAQRVELKRPAATSNQQPSEPAPSEPAQPAKPSPAGVLPVAATARTAQPATQLIDPANLDRAIKDMPTDLLEAALLGTRTDKVLLRL